MLVFPIAELLELSKEKGNEIIKIHPERLINAEAYCINLTLLDGEEHLNFSILENYT